MEGTWGYARSAVCLATQAAVIVLRSKALKKGDRLWKRLNALYRTVRHVDGRLAASADLSDVSAPAHQIGNEFIVSSSCSVVDRVVAIVISKAHIGAKFLHEKSDRGKPTSRYVTM